MVIGKRICLALKTRKWDWRFCFGAGKQVFLKFDCKLLCGSQLLNVKMLSLFAIFFDKNKSMFGQKIHVINLNILFPLALVLQN